MLSVAVVSPSTVLVTSDCPAGVRMTFGEQSFSDSCVRVEGVVPKPEFSDPCTEALQRLEK
ncbi:hypothetical protein GCM10009000_112540 [Halobacterium noricense]